MGGAAAAGGSCLITAKISGGMMQPKIELSLFYDDDTQMVNVDVDSEDGGIGKAYIAEGKNEQSAYRMAARRLRMLANQAEKRADKIKYTQRQN